MCCASRAAAVAVATLISAVKKGQIEKDSVIMLNITGGGMEKFKRENECIYVKPIAVFPINPDHEKVKSKLAEIFLIN